MKKLLKYSFLIFGLSILGSCGLTDLDLLDNPNEVSPDNAELDLVYNSVMYNFGRFTDEASDETMPYVRMTNMGAGNQYNNQDTPASFDFIWDLAYAQLFPDIDLVITLASANGLTTYSGSAKIIKAHVAMTMVDLFGNIPYSQAGLGAENQNPGQDSGADIYADALTLLDAGIADLSNPVGRPANDVIYGDAADVDAQAAKWIKAANSLKLRYYVNTRLVADNASAINSIVSSGNYIQDKADDFQFNYGPSRNTPDSRHPYYTDGYEAGGPSWYMSNYYMWLMFGEKINEDPRLRYYFYRQDCDETDEDQFTLDCPTAPYPSHWDAGYPWCTASGDFGDPAGEYSGYWGRDHGNDDGIPPDDLKRTAWGLYPAGGKFDADDCAQVSNGGTDGAGGDGIQPILLASGVDFLIAEAILTEGASGDAAAYLESGVEKSFDKVLNFEGGAPDGWEPSMADQDAYITEVLTAYNNASGDERLNVVMKEFYLSLFGNGLDAFNNYRRTGMPLRMQPTRDAAPGDFARSMWYPSDYVNLNSSISDQKAITNQVFWDTNPPGFIK